MSETLLYAPTPAKINLFLKVTGRRPDGYHELESIFLPLHDLQDDIAIDLEGFPGTLTVGSSDVLLPNGLSNIAGKAADIWSKRAAVMPHWDINIVKNIPVAAGLGGGSSDAGKVLTLLNNYYNKTLSEAALAELALELGADVPFFLKPVPAMVSGIGEKIEPLDFKIGEFHLLLLAPSFPVSAAEGYRLLNKKLISPMDENTEFAILQSLQTGDAEKLGSLIFNDLQAGVFDKYPLLGILREDVMHRGAINCIMSGSGPTLFAIYSDAAKRDCALEELKNIHPECAVYALILR